MKKQRWFFPVIVFAMMMVGALAILGLAPKELVYAGRPVSLWAGDLDNARTPERERARQAVRAIGTKALPVFVDMLRYRDSRLKQIALEWLDKQRVVKVRFESAERRHIQARLGIALLGSQAKAALPELIGLFEDEPIHPSAAWSDVASAVADVGPDAVAPLTAALATGNERSRCHAIESLALLGVNAQPALPGLVKACRDRSENVRWRACRALAKIPSPPESVMHALIAALDDPSANVRWTSALALGEFGAKASAAVATLRAMAQTTSDPRIRYGATQALSSIDPRVSGRSEVP